MTILRKQYAHNAVRRPLPVIGRYVHKLRGKYMPHQGKQECARRVLKRDDLISRVMDQVMP